ncbi:MAG: arginine--tRNA ligase [Polaromonas sp.]|uniref:arginine--tRNA ligase n=1 Tax=Polaromonas sp. TaxID=1869339 RepID=UPI002717491B|nr:arginine--tRNA ligase [Polaromonas sp.]MDO9115941.1 arginine--tRNA ligase [Polaromonas sp.]MDP1886751.1 arginine--tRNA ligase [Polaromonas sp.]
MLLVKQELLAVLAAELDKLSPGAGQKAAFESPKVAAHGDFASTAAMQLAKPLKLNPRQLAESLRESLLAAPAYQRWVDAVEIAGPGFINFRLKPAAKQETVREVLTAAGQYGVKPLDKMRRVVVEFVSANPTGPLHVGHGRQAALGDAICNLFATQGWDVYREFYYNDAGVQIHTLATSTQARAKGLKPGDALWPEPAYNGDYIADIAADFMAQKTVKSDDREFTASGDIEDLDAIRQFAVAYLRHEQDLDLKAFAVGFDNYYLESSLYSSGRVEATVARLKEAGKTYEQDGALWLKSTDYGDDKDRVMKKSDGSYTYFVPDVAYHLAKWERGFTRAINIQGMDHHGTIARVRAGLQAAGAGIPQGYPDYVLHTMVRVMRHGEEVKISKRAGSYVTLRDLIEWTSKDAVRFFLLSRKPDTEYVFDIDLALAKNNENPVYYVQYAHARICSVLAAWGGDVATLKGMDLSALDSPQAQALMLLMAKYPDMLANAATGFAPHDVAFYLRELAASYHSYYDAERILVDDDVVKLARLALVAATAQVLHNGLKVLGVDAPQKM